MPSLTTSGDGIEAQPPSALRVAGGAGPSATPALLNDVPHRSRRAGVAYGTAAHATPRAQLVQRFPSAGRRRFDYPLSVGIIDGGRAYHVALDGRSIEALKKRMNQLA